MSDPMDVLVVDDSPVVRQTLKLVLGADPSLRVTAYGDPTVALERAIATGPAAIVLDLMMPGMDGIAFLERLMAARPVPVVVCSGAAAAGSDAAMRALAAGAIDVVPKPTEGVRRFLEGDGERLLRIVKSAAQGRIRPRTPMPALAPTASRAPPPLASRAPRPMPSPPRAAPAPLTGAGDDVLLAIAASTGGTEALAEVLRRVSPDSPPIVVVQHMPPGFTATFARRLDGLSPMHVAEATDGEVLRRGHVLVAPGGRHLRVARQGARLVARVDDGERVSRHRPSADALFHSVADACGPRAVGVVLTGMGDDGARGLLAMRQRGAETFVQDEASSVVWGMPGAAVALGAAREVVALALVPETLRAATQRVRARA
ncbi:MAG: chemotaxis-specific protein-glutamate methyltransferase CheB [Polyangiales bacterium]